MRGTSALMRAAVGTAVVTMAEADTIVAARATLGDSMVRFGVWGAAMDVTGVTRAAAIGTVVAGVMRVSTVVVTTAVTSISTVVVSTAVTRAAESITIRIVVGARQ